MMSGAKRNTASAGRIRAVKAVAAVSRIKT